MLSYSEMKNTSSYKVMKQNTVIIENTNGGEEDDDNSEGLIGLNWSSWYGATRKRVTNIRIDDDQDILNITHKETFKSDDAKRTDKPAASEGLFSFTSLFSTVKDKFRSRINEYITVGVKDQREFTGAGDVETCCGMASLQTFRSANLSTPPASQSTCEYESRQKSHGNPVPCWSQHDSGNQHRSITSAICQIDSETIIDELRSLKQLHVIAKDSIWHKAAVELYGNRYIHVTPKEKLYEAKQTISNNEFENAHNQSDRNSKDDRKHICNRTKIRKQKPNNCEILKTTVKDVNVSTDGSFLWRRAVIELCKTLEVSDTSKDSDKSNLLIKCEGAISKRQLKPEREERMHEVSNETVTDNSRNINPTDNYFRNLEMYLKNLHNCYEGMKSSSICTSQTDVRRPNKLVIDRSKSCIDFSTESFDDHRRIKYNCRGKLHSDSVCLSFNLNSRRLPDEFKIRTWSVKKYKSTDNSDETSTFVTSNSSHNYDTLRFKSPSDQYFLHYGKTYSKNIIRKSMKKSGYRAKPHRSLSSRKLENDLHSYSGSALMDDLSNRWVSKSDNEMNEIIHKYNNLLIDYKSLRQKYNFIDDGTLSVEVKKVKKVFQEIIRKETSFDNVLVKREEFCKNRSNFLAPEDDTSIISEFDKLSPDNRYHMSYTCNPLFLKMLRNKCVKKKKCKCKDITPIASFIMISRSEDENSSSAKSEGSTHSKERTTSKKKNEPKGKYYSKKKKKGRTKKKIESESSETCLTETTLESTKTASTPSKQVKCVSLNEKECHSNYSRPSFICMCCNTKSKKSVIKHKTVKCTETETKVEDCSCPLPEEKQFSRANFFFNSQHVTRKSGNACVNFKKSSGNSFVSVNPPCSDTSDKGIQICFNEPSGYREQAKRLLCCCCKPNCSFKESLKKMFCISLPSCASSESRCCFKKNKEYAKTYTLFFNKA